MDWIKFASSYDGERGCKWNIASRAALVSRFCLARISGFLRLFPAYTIVGVILFISVLAII